MKSLFWLSFSFLLLLSACKDDDMGKVVPLPCEESLTDISYAPTAKDLTTPDYFPPLEIPVDNPMTEEGVDLGRRLFYDKILSSDSTLSCASCHNQAGNFTDNEAFSLGVTGELGGRSSMALINVGYLTNGLFWDGRAATVEQQAGMPVEDPVEMHEDWDNVEIKLQSHSTYPELFRKAFGIETKCDITRALAEKAIAQFERTLISSDAKYDKVIRGEDFFTDSELNGWDMFFDVSPDIPDAECGHCHEAPLFTTNDYFNNGIEDVDNLEGFPDLGFGGVTGNIFDNGKFRAPSLRNIMLSAPYMHDGRFETIEEVIAHYNSGGHFADNLDPLMRPLNLSPSEIDDLIAFLHTLTDMSFIDNEEYGDPFD